MRHVLRTLEQLSDPDDNLRYWKRERFLMFIEMLHTQFNSRRCINYKKPKEILPTFECKISLLVFGNETLHEYDRFFFTLKFEKYLQSSTGGP